MKTTTPMQRAAEPADASARRPRRGIVCWTLTCFGLGVVAATAYLLLGGAYFLSIPGWAFIVFYPGFFVGHAAYDWGLSQEVSEVVGVLAVGVAYAALAMLTRLFWFALKHCRQSAAMSKKLKAPLFTLLTAIIIFSTVGCGKGTPRPRLEMMACRVEPFASSETSKCRSGLPNWVSHK